MVLGIIRHCLSIDERLTSVIFVLDIQVGIRKDPADSRQFLNLVREFFGNKGSKSKVMLS